MNPIAASVAPVMNGAARDTQAVPTDLASIFAAIFAATAVAAAAAAPPPIAVPALALGAGEPTASPHVEGQAAEPPPGGRPGGSPGASSVGSSFTVPALPGRTALPALARPHAELSTPAESPGDLAPFQRDPGERAAAPTTPPVVAATPVTPAALLADRPAIAQAAPVAARPSATSVQLASLHQAAPAAADSKRAERGKHEDQAPLLARSARDGGKPVAAPAATVGATPAERGKANADPRSSGDGSRPPTGEAAAAAPQAVALPVTPSPAAHGAGVAPHPPLVQSTHPATPGVVAPAPLMEERPPLALPSHATVAFDSGDGQEGRLRVALRGNTLRATIEMPDAAAAQRLEQNAGNLSRALRAQGFEEARLVIDSPRAAGTSERAQDESPREHRQPREGQSHAGERNARRERGASRNER